MSITLRIRTLLILAVAGAALLAVSDANAACTGGSTQVFRQWGDLSYYDLFQNGGFENNGAGWTVAGGAQIVTGNEPFFLNKANDARSASLPAGGSITSAAFCISAKTPYARFLAHSGTFSGSSLRVDVLCSSGSPAVPLVVGDRPIWFPTPAIPMAGCLPAALLSGGSAMVQLRVTAVTGHWQVDDFFLDPFKGI